MEIPVTQSNRKLMRNLLRKRVGNNRINSAWYKVQAQRYGEPELHRLHVSNMSARQRRANK